MVEEEAWQPGFAVVCCGVGKYVVQWLHSYSVENSGEERFPGHPEIALVFFSGEMYRYTKCIDFAFTSRNDISCCIFDKTFLKTAFYKAFYRQTSM